MCILTKIIGEYLINNDGHFGIYLRIFKCEYLQIFIHASSYSDDTSVFRLMKAQEKAGNWGPGDREIGAYGARTRIEGSVREFPTVESKAVATL